MLDFSISINLVARCSSELAQLVPFPYSSGRSTSYSDKIHDFFETIPRFYKDVFQQLLYILAQLDPQILSL